MRAEELQFIEVNSPELISQTYSLLNTCFLSDGHPPIGEHAWLDLVQGGRKSFFSYLVKISSHPHPIGYLHISKGDQSWAIDYVVHPHHRDKQGSIETRIIAKAQEIIKQSFGGHVHLWVPKPTEATDKAAFLNGFTKGRDLYQMTLDLPVFCKFEPLKVRPFRLGHDEKQWLELNNKAFLNHPEQGNWDLSTLKARFNQPWFSPEDLLIYEQDNKIVAFCWVKIHFDKDPPAGEIYIVAVDPALQGQHIGKRIVLTALEHMVSKSIKRAFLYVDSTNKPALKIYKDIGFTIDHIDRAYVKDI